MSDSIMLQRLAIVRKCGDIGVADSVDIAVGVTDPEAITANIAALAVRDRRSLSHFPKGSTNGVYAVPTKHRKVLGGKSVLLRWDTYKGSKPYPMFVVDGTKIRRRDAETGEFTEEYLLLHNAFTGGLIPIKPKPVTEAAKPQAAVKDDRIVL